MQTKDKLFSALVSIVLGLLLLILKGEVISIVLTIIGVVLLLAALADFRSQRTNGAIIKAVIGVCVLAFGWAFVNLALYIVAAVIIIMGLMQISDIRKTSPVNLTLMEKVVIYAKPVLTVVAGAFLFLNQGGAINWVFIVTGLLLIAEGVLELLAVKR